MKVYLVEFGGHYLGGQMIVVTTSTKKALNRAKKKLEEIGLDDKNKSLDEFDVSEINIEKEQVYVIDDGDY